LLSYLEDCYPSLTATLTPILSLISQFDQTPSLPLPYKYPLPNSLFLKQDISESILKVEFTYALLHELSTLEDIKYIFSIEYKQKELTSKIQQTQVNLLSKYLMAFQEHYSQVES